MVMSFGYMQVPQIDLTKPTRTLRGNYACQDLMIRRSTLLTSSLIGSPKKRTDHGFLHWIMPTTSICFQTSTLCRLSTPKFEWYCHHYNSRQESRGEIDRWRRSDHDRSI
jgi:hypothetical protein